MTENKVKHSYAVAVRMQELCMTEPYFIELDPEDMFTLGYLHDIGYQFVLDQQDHPKAGYETLKKQGYKYSKEVYYHGMYQQEYKSLALDLLNYADLTTNSRGEYVTMDERLEDIRRRYGAKSLQAKNATEVARELSIKLEKV